MTGWLKRLSWIDIGILAIAAGLRIALLDIKPAHFDEGVNGWFADQMERTGYFPLRSDELPWTSALLCPLPVADPFRTKSVGIATACDPRKPAGGLGGSSFSRAFWRHDRSHCCTRDGGLTCLRILRPLFDSRVLAGSLFADLLFGVCLAFGQRASVGSFSCCWPEPPE